MLTNFLLFAIGIASAEYVTGSDGVTVWPHDLVLPHYNKEGNDPTYPPMAWLPSYSNAFKGCDAYPAVDEAGHASNGLRATYNFNYQDQGRQCNHGKMQVYFRNATIRNQFAMAYTIYLPKEDAQDMLQGDKGQRNIFKTAVIWFQDAKAKTPLYLSLMQNGKFTRYGPDHFTVHPKAAIAGGGTVLLETSLYALKPSIQNGDFGDLEPWDLMPPAMKHTFEVHSWGSDTDQNFPLSDKNWFGTLILAL